MSNIVLGIVGLAGSGKSTLARHLVTRNDFEEVCLDSIGHQVLKEAQVIDWVRRSFGSNIIEKGHVNRALLGRIVFQDSEQLTRLNAFVHPILIDRAKTRLLESSKNMVVHGALLVDFELHAYCDLCIGLDVDFEDIAHFSNPKQWKIAGLQSQMHQHLKEVDYVLCHTYDERFLIQEVDKILLPYLKKTSD